MAVMMVMIAMLVVTMAVMVMVIAMVTMIVRRMIVPGMRRRVVGVGMVAAGIGAAFGIERRLDLDHARTKPPDHGFDDMIAPDPQPLGHDLGRQMAVAEMPGDPDQMMRVGSPDLQQRLGRRHHLDQPAVLEHQRIAAAKCYGVFQVEQEFKPARARHRHPPPVPVVEIEHDGIGRRFCPAMLRANLRGADHARAVPLPVIARRPFPA